MATQDEILRQLAQLHSVVGKTVATVEALREELRDSATSDAKYRDQVGAALTNAVTRLGQVESDLKEVRLVVEKTVQPLIKDYSNSRQRLIGFMAAVSVAGAFVTGLWWLLSVVIPAVIKYFEHRGTP